MDFNEVEQIFSVYGTPSIVIAVIVSVISIIIDKLVSKKISFRIKAYLPFLLGIILYILYDLIFLDGSPIISKESISRGFIAGTIASILFAILRKIVTGKGVKSVVSPLALLIESIILPLVAENKLETAVVTIEKLLRNLSAEEDDEIVANEIASVISEHSNENTTEVDCINSARLIVTGKSNLGKK